MTREHCAKRFAEVPDVISRLEADAVALRRREQQLSDVLARVVLDAGADHNQARASTARDMESARDSVRQRLASAVAALESIRLDLLRLHAGIGSADDLTTDLKHAREISAAVNAELAAREEVIRLLPQGRGSGSGRGTRRGTRTALAPPTPESHDGRIDSECPKA